MFVLSSHSAWCFLLTRYAIVANLKMSTFLDLLSGKEYTFLLIRHPQPLLCLLQSRVSVNVCKMTEEVFPRYKHTEVRDMDQIISFWEEKQRILSILHRHGLSCHQEIRGASALGRLRGMVWGGRREECSGWGTHVYLWRIHFDIWQN